MERTRIIIPNYNTTNYLKSCLQAVDKHTPGIGDAVEVIVIDNGSVDGAREYLSRCRESKAGYQVIYNEENLGVYNAWNAGISSPGKPVDFIVLLGSDTEVQPGWIEALWGCFDVNPEAGIASAMLIKTKVGFDTFVVFGGSRNSAEHPHKVGLLDAHPEFKEPREYDWVTFSCAMFRKEMMIDEIGYFDEEFNVFCGDHDYCQRARKAGWEIWYWPTAICVHWEGKGVLELRKVDMEIDDKIDLDQERLSVLWGPKLKE